MSIDVVGIGDTGFEASIPMPLEELIYSATTGALSDAGIDVDELDGVYLAASDVFDGRGISTMTLTGATGSHGKPELRVCGDGLGALTVAATELAMGSVHTAIVSAWSKLSEADLPALEPLGLDPALLRPLGLSGADLLRLRASRSNGAARAAIGDVEGSLDGAISLVVTTEKPGTKAGTILGHGLATGRYFGLDDSFLSPLRIAIDGAIAEAAISPDTISTVYCGGFVGVSNEALQELFPRPWEIRRPHDPGITLGYAAGLAALGEALRADTSNPFLVISSSGPGAQSSYAAVGSIL